MHRHSSVCVHMHARTHKLSAIFTRSWYHVIIHPLSHRIKKPEYRCAELIPARPPGSQLDPVLSKPDRDAQLE